MAVARGVGAVIAEEIVGRGILLHAFENFGEVVGVEKGAAAGVTGESDQRFLGGEIGIQGVERGLSGIGGDAAQAGVLGFAACDQGLQAAHVHGVNREVGTDGGVYGGAQLGLIFDAGAVHAAGKIDQRFFLLNVRKLFGY